MAEIQNTTQTNAQTAQNAQETAPAAQADNNAATAENAAQSDAQPEKTFTQDELNKILTDRLKAEQKKWEKKAAEEKEEAERVAKMTADEKAKHDHEKRERDFAEREAALSHKERTAAARELLIEKGVPVSLVGAVDVSSDEAVSESVEALAKAFTEAVSAEVQKRLASAPPKRAESTEGSDLEKQIASVFRKH